MSNDTQAATLTDFLLARFAEEEAAARDAGGRRWYAVGGEIGDDPRGLSCFEYVGDLAEHMARWDPARVLAECEEKRNLVNYAAFMLQAWADKPGGAYPDMTRRERHTANVILMHLAAVYADHPDYRPEWRL